jgi:hypothetical protein
VAKSIVFIEYPFTDQRRHGALRFFVATARMRDLLFRAKHLFVAAKMVWAADHACSSAHFPMVGPKVRRQQAKSVADNDGNCVRPRRPGPLLLMDFDLGELS